MLSGTDQTTMKSGPLPADTSEVDGSNSRSRATFASSALDGRVGNCICDSGSHFKGVLDLESQMHRSSDSRMTSRRAHV